MQPILAEVCTRWGCTWQEGIINVFLASFGLPGLLILLAMLLSPILLLIGGWLRVSEFISGLSKAKQNFDNLDKFQQQGKQILTTAKFVGRTAKVINKAVKDYRQEQNVVNQAKSQEKDMSESDENAVSEEAVNNSVESQPQRQRIQTAAKILGQTAKVANKAITAYQQQQELENKAKSDENTFSEEVANNSLESQPQRQRIKKAAKFLGRTLGNIAND
jgi:hypothetical protein